MQNNDCWFVCFADGKKTRVVDVHIKNHAFDALFAANSKISRYPGEPGWIAKITHVFQNVYCGARHRTKAI